MRRLIKRSMTALFQPLSWLADHLATPLRRAWSHAQVAAKISHPLDPSVVLYSTPEIHGTARIKMGKNLLLYRDIYLETMDDGSIEIGDGVVMSRGVHIASRSNITIGPGTMIGEYSSIRDANHQVLPGLPLRSSGFKSSPITIGSNVWIGRGVMVLPGIKIGDRAVIGANAVVTRDVPPDAVVGGIPAKPLHQSTTALV